MPTERFTRQVLARDDNLCQRRNPGCTITATHVEMAYTVEELRAFRRDPNSPDNWLSVCDHCAQPVHKQQD